jgi:hypothetical protein
LPVVWLIASCDKQATVSGFSRPDVAPAKVPLWGLDTTNVVPNVWRACTNGSP